jgi:hypothetical protein
MVFHLIFILAGRPCHDAPAEDVQVDVKYALPGVPVAVDERPEAALSYSFLRGQFRGQAVEMSHQGVVFGAEIKYRGYVFFRYYEEMDGSLRVNVLEGHGQVVLVDYPRGYFFFGYFAEQTIHTASFAVSFILRYGCAVWRNGYVAWRNGYAVWRYGCATAWRNDRAAWRYGCAAWRYDRAVWRYGRAAWRNGCAVWRYGCAAWRNVRAAWRYDRAVWRYGCAAWRNDRAVWRYDRAA